MTRTYTRADLDISRAEWDALRVSSEWEPIRRLAAERGMLRPPNGTRWDSWEDPQPSQFALIAREINYGWSQRVLEIVGQSWSWTTVVRRILQDRDMRSEQAALRERDTEWERSSRPSHAEAAMSVASILRRISDSAPGGTE